LSILTEHRAVPRLLAATYHDHVEAVATVLAGDA
jgi:hypothetical protein